MTSGIREFIPNLYVSNFIDVRPSTIEKAKITRAVNLSEFNTPLGLFKKDFHIEINSKNENEIEIHFDKTNEWIRYELETKNRVLIYCSTPDNRRSSIVLAAFMMIQRGWSMERVRDRFEEMKSQVVSSVLFLKKLELCRSIQNPSSVDLGKRKFAISEPSSSMSSTKRARHNDNALKAYLPDALSKLINEYKEPPPNYYLEVEVEKFDIGVLIDGIEFQKEIMQSPSFITWKLMKKMDDHTWRFSTVSSYNMEAVSKLTGEVIKHLVAENPDLRRANMTFKVFKVILDDFVRAK